MRDTEPHRGKTIVVYKCLLGVVVEVVSVLVCASECSVCDVSISGGIKKALCEVMWCVMFVMYFVGVRW